MSLSFRGPGGHVEQRWIVYATLRDNVQHYLEASTPTGEFTELHKVADVLARGEIELDAAKLHAELARAKPELVKRPISELAISVRTQALLSFAWPPADRAETHLVRETDIDVAVLAPRARTLDDAFGYLMESLLTITANARPGDVVRVTDL